ncbi:MAG: hypothetical protein K6F80_00715 [Oscillospiraceae bacterium]|nr:hypothetical protein [Oscillospiraceae bacterium]
MNCIFDSVPPTPARIGGKAYHLTQLDRMGMPVPVWTVLPVEAFTAFLGKQAETFRRLLADYKPQHREELLRILDHCAFPSDIRSRIAQQLRTLFGEDTPLAVRSSAADEDGTQHSFAGMLESVLPVRGLDAVLEAVRVCYRSCFSERAMQYRMQNGLISPDIAPAVIVQEMISADYSGVIFTTDPTTNNPDEMLVSAVCGMGEQLVSGASDSSDYVIGFGGAVVHRRETGVHLSEALLSALYETAQKIEQGFSPRIGQDIEFCIADGKIYIVQTRPVTAYSGIDKNAFRTVLDNSNIIESYSGVTTPLTFTFAREVYAKIYRQTLRTFYVSEEAIASISDDLDNMLCFYENKIYYRLNSWYRMTALYPGYQKNKQYMETMMGVKMTVHESPTAAKTRLVRIYASFLLRMLHMKRDSRRFLERFAQVTAPYYANRFEGYSNAQALAVYDTLEREILDDFITPIANDMGAMVFYGMLTDQFRKAKIEDAEGLLSRVIGRQGNVESAQQSAAVLDIVREIRRSPELTALFLSENEAILPHLQDEGEVFRKIRDYIHRFGARTMDELKLETVTLFEDPSFLLDTLRGYLHCDTLPESSTAQDDSAERELLRRFPVLKRPVVRTLLHITKYFIRNRESLRLRRTYIYSVVRNLYLRIGSNLAAEGFLQQVRDVFFLEKDEISQLTAGTLPDRAELQKRLTERRTAYAENRPRPIYDRMYFYGSMTPAHMIPVYTRQETDGGTLLHGAAGGGTVVTGVVKLVENPAHADAEGYILMAKRTDPGWTVLFPMVKAVIIERGSVLSHSAVVAREMGITLVAGIRGLTDTVKDGMTVRVDGVAGTVEILQTEGENP